MAWEPEGGDQGLHLWEPPHLFSSQPSSSPEPDRGRGGIAFHRLSDLEILVCKSHKAHRSLHSQARPQAAGCHSSLQRHCGWIPHSTGALSTGFWKRWWFSGARHWEAKLGTTICEAEMWLCPSCWP